MLLVFLVKREVPSIRTVVSLDCFVARTAGILSAYCWAAASLAPQCSAETPYPQPHLPAGTPALQNTVASNIRMLALQEQATNSANCSDVVA